MKDLHQKLQRENRKKMAFALSGEIDAEALDNITSSTINATLDEVGEVIKKRVAVIEEALKKATEVKELSTMNVLAGEKKALTDLKAKLGKDV